MSQTEATSQKLNSKPGNHESEKTTRKRLWYENIPSVEAETVPVKLALLNTFLAAGTVRNLVKETCKRTITTQQAEAFLDLFQEELQAEIDNAVRQTIIRHFKQTEATSETKY